MRWPHQPLALFPNRLWADVAGRNNSGAKQIERAKVCNARKSRAGSQSRSDAFNDQPEAMMDEIFLSLARMRELVKEPGLAVVMKNGRWLYSFYVNRR